MKGTTGAGNKWHAAPAKRMYITRMKRVTLLLTERWLLRGQWPPFYMKFLRGLRAYKARVLNLFRDKDPFERWVLVIDRARSREMQMWSQDCMEWMCFALLINWSPHSVYMTYMTDRKYFLSFISMGSHPRSQILTRMTVYNSIPCHPPGLLVLFSKQKYLQNIVYIIKKYNTEIQKYNDYKDLFFYQNSPGTLRPNNRLSGF